MNQRHVAHQVWFAIAPRSRHQKPPRRRFLRAGEPHVYDPKTKTGQRFQTFRQTNRVDLPDLGLTYCTVRSSYMVLRLALTQFPYTQDRRTTPRLGLCSGRASDRGRRSSSGRTNRPPKHPNSSQLFWKVPPVVFSAKLSDHV